MKCLCSAVALVLLVALPAQAQQLNLQMNAGRVTLDAVNVPAGQILAEWARVGGTKVVGAEKITGTPLTLKLVDMPERQALDIILRNVAGFMAAPRQASALPGASAYDRILIMATSSVVPSQPAASNQPGQNFGAMDGTQRRVPPRPPNLPPGVGVGDEPVQDDQGMETDQSDTGMVEQPVFTFPAPGAAGSPFGPGNENQNPVFVPMPQGGFGNPAPGGPPVITLQPGANGPTIYNFVPSDQQAPPAQPTTGFGIVGSPQPGIIMQPPPTQPTRPPG